MDQNLHNAVRKVVSDWVIENGDASANGVMFDASVVTSALLEVVAEVIAAGPPDHRQSFVASLHRALDELVDKKAAANQVAYSAPLSLDPART